ncbi:hypothetical protein ATCC90586_003287 [Pythium insidiosum]|nr:hypothetical protein ATCC90586_003287 [Pythium insidiosum]
MEVVLLGCGPSSSVPALRCVLRGECRVCLEAHENRDSKNRRLNPSLLVRDVARDVNVLIDCGKTFRESMLRSFPALGTQHVDAVVLTHGHADACLGLDDLREVQKFDVHIDPETGESQKKPHEPMGLHCNAATQAEMGDKFSYLMEKEEERAQREALANGNGGDGADKSSGGAPFRWVAKLQWKIFDWWQRFNVCGFDVLPFPVEHGKGYLSSAFEFGGEFGVRIVYISDVSQLTVEAHKYLNDSSKAPIDVLIIDALYLENFHSTHMNLQDVLHDIRTIRPRRTVLTGMSHEFDYEPSSAALAAIGEREGLVVEMGYDGMRLQFPAQ